MGVPSAIGWAIAIWASGEFRWGVASGFCVGLHCCALSLKSWSFAHKIGFDVAGGVPFGSCFSRCEDVDSDDADDDGDDAVIEAVSSEDGEGEAESCASERRQEGADDRESEVTGGEESTVDDDGVTEGADGTPGDVNGSRDGRLDDHDKDSATDHTEASALFISDTNITGNICTLPSPNPFPTPAGKKNLTFLEFSYFLLLAPSLVCEPSWLRRSFRLRPRIRAALVEFFHAVLTYVALHVYCVNLVAPTFRILSAAWSSSGGSNVDAPSLWFFSLGGRMMTLNVQSLEELRANGGGGWVMSFVDFTMSTVAASGCDGGDGVGYLASWGRFVRAMIPTEALRCGEGTGESSDVAQMMTMAEAVEPASMETIGDPAAGLPEMGLLAPMSEWAWTGIVALAACSTCLFSPLNHALPFYAFFHCICLGTAELWGYPDRNFYGERRSGRGGGEEGGSVLTYCLA